MSGAVARMIRTLLVAFCLLLASQAFAGDLDALDRDNGFGRARLGTSVETLEGIELITERAARGTSLFALSGAMPPLGEAHLDDVTLGFYEGRLYFVALFTSGRRDAQAALSALQAAYGPGTAIVGDVPEYVWQGQRVSLHFRQDPVTEMGMVGFTSRAIDMQMKHRSQGESLPANAATD